MKEKFLERAASDTTQGRKAMQWAGDMPSVSVRTLPTKANVIYNLFFFFFFAAGGPIE